MKAVAYQQSLPIDAANALVDVELPVPVAGEHDLLVAVRAISVNPVDTKVRRGVTPAAGEWKVLGWDVAGEVVGVGAAVRGFAPGDRVWYAGSIARPGGNSELHAVDARIAAKMPSTVDFAQAAALPLTAITAWEILFDRLGLHAASTGTLLVIGAAGGVGSILVQLARQLTGLTVVGTASRAETRDWLLDLGAHAVVDHGAPLAAGLRAAGYAEADYVVSLNQSEQHFAEVVELIAPQGKFALIDDPASLDIVPLKRKSVSVHWEFMFTRPLFATADLARQGELLAELARLVDDGRVRTTLAANLGRIDAANLRRAHALIESGKARGKLVLAGF
ncbi:zinc-binding alcohol dehydrogenase family protein [Azonexus fungiphilus]|uniref:zinc-binding alcohol dehydrogenase family protein n=1 Tax=Azonexus fungiphilus TaxID=146940 RepID=UPI00156ABD87|nr:zinc-binding alcohol dehydrogenase family protein [Azonexus fungiphilus]NHC05429.1 zinc-binding alcohol dehydrogenase family protein [Azonexus fungiphilus]